MDHIYFPTIGVLGDCVVFDLSLLIWKKQTETTTQKKEQQNRSRWRWTTVDTIGRHVSARLWQGVLPCRAIVDLFDEKKVEVPCLR